MHALESEILIMYTSRVCVPGGNMTSEADLTEDVRRLRISGSANCLDSPDRREMPAASRRASSLAWVSWSTPAPCCWYSGSGEWGGARDSRNSGSGSELARLPPSSIRKEST